MDLKARMRTHLVTSKYYSAKTLLDAVESVSEIMLHEKAILMMRSALFAECFDHCIKSGLDESFTLEVADLGLKWHSDSRVVYYNLFKSLLKAGQAERAINILS